MYHFNLMFSLPNFRVTRALSKDTLTSHETSSSIDSDVLFWGWSVGSKKHATSSDEDVHEVPVDAAKCVTRHPKPKKVDYINFNLGWHCKCIVTIAIHFGYLTLNFVVLISGKAHRQQ